MVIVGRKKEQQILQDCLDSNRPEFVAVYGRRRVGKTYMIREFFGGRFSFYATGVANKKTKEQLAVFNDWLVRSGSHEKKAPENWREAFRRLISLLEQDNVYRDPTSNKRIIFLDELPWMDTARSDFKCALDLFWNGWASGKDDIVLIVCGSATSWVISNLIQDTGGFYNRITRQIHLSPFTLGECEALLLHNDFPLSRRQILDVYMVFGGIPYYLYYLDRRISIAQNIDSLILNENGSLHNEYEMLFNSLFRNSEKHQAVIEELARSHNGLLRTELAAKEKIGDGEPLTKTLTELEQCGFIRKYRNYTKQKNGCTYQLIDPFVLFYLRFVKTNELKIWGSFRDTGAYYSWRGLSFEIVCMNHIEQIKAALGISGVETIESAWKSAAKKGGAQIDLLIDRKDDAVNICEMKYSDSKFVIDEEYSRVIRNKVNVFREETGTKKALIPTLVSVEGMERGAYSDVIFAELTATELF